MNATDGPDSAPGGSPSLAALLLDSAERHPERPALAIGGREIGYRTLWLRAASLAAAIRRLDPEEPTVALLARRSVSAYAGVLGILLAGRGYAPLSPSFPVERNRRVLAASGASVVICDGGHEERLEALLDPPPRPLTAILPERSTPPAWSRDRVRALCARDLPAIAPQEPPRLRPGAIAYLLFTSGTTGAPKGIGVPEANVLAYLAAVGRRYGFGPDDRFSQNFELTFDLSVHDLLAAWTAGACVAVPGEREAMAPARFVRDQRLTCWFSTPSTARLMMRLRMLGAEAFPTLRWSLFCGEPLPLEVAAAWQRAAPGSAIENLYGPTEATIACTAYRFSPEETPGDCRHGIVPIGVPFGDTRCAVVDERGGPVRPGEPGELLLAGPQVAPGYWRDPELTAAGFVERPDLGPGPWYRTGDLVAAGPRGLVYHGRIDDQVKILGHRVELAEVEAAVRSAGDAAEAAALAWPPTASGADGVIAFVAGAAAPDDQILAGCRRLLPPYMVPREIHRLEALPLTAHGKVDRRRLAELRERRG